MKPSTKNLSSVSGKRVRPLATRAINKSKAPSRASTNGSKPELRIKSILVPIDFSIPSIKALKYAAAFAEQFGAKLTLLNVVEPVGLPDFATHPLFIENDKLTVISESRLQRLCPKIKIHEKLVEKVLVRTGVPFNEIASAARTLKVDLIIIATEGNTGFKHLLLGSTAERVVRHAPCPVFVVRETEREILN